MRTMFIAYLVVVVGGLAYLLVIVTIFILINFVVDVLYSVLDPRVRLGSAAGAH